MISMDELSVSRCSGRSMSNSSDSIGERTDAHGFQFPLLAGQWAATHQHREMSPETALALAIISQASADWIDLNTRGRVTHSTHGDEFTREDARELRDYIFEDSFGRGDETFLPLRDLCKALVIEISDLRDQLLRFGSLENFDHIVRKLPTERAIRDRGRPANRRHINERQAA